jgi:hypothetical protein
MSFRIQKLAGRSQKTTAVVLVLILTALAAASISLMRYRSAKPTAAKIN